VIEKTDLGVRGLAQFVFSEFCRTDWSDRPLVNAGDDWGLETLVWTKQSYRPVKMLQKYAFRLAARAVAAVPPIESTGPAEPIVRRARKTDVPAALALEQACFTAHRLTRRQLQYLQDRPSAIFLVADSAGSIAGQIIGLIRHHPRGLSGRIYSLAVAPDHRRRKLGLKLLRALVEELASRGVRRIYLEVEQDNVPAIALYAREGFRPIGSLPDYYAAGSDGTHMMLELAAPVARSTSSAAA
jgi:ribosomal protein S18 acetylase RimI-like enzyme